MRPTPDYRLKCVTVETPYTTSAVGFTKTHGSPSTVYFGPDVIEIPRTGHRNLVLVIFGAPKARCYVIGVPLRIPLGEPPVLSVPLGSIYTTKALKFHEAYS